MQPSPPVRSATSRMLLALAVFATALAGGVYWAVGYHGQSDEKVRNSAPGQRTPGAADPASATAGDFFYDSIGSSTASSSPGSSADGQAQTPGSSASYTLELRVAATQREAEQLVQSYQDRGIEAYYTPMTRAGRVVYRVRRGIYRTEAEAGRARVALGQDHAVAADVVRLQ